jgi:hypothetical protein
MSDSQVNEDEPPCPRARPLIPVASLADYDNRRLRGVWIYADADWSDIEAAIPSMLAASSAQHARVWAIHDHECFEPLLIELARRGEPVRTTLDPLHRPNTAHRGHLRPHSAARTHPADRRKLFVCVTSALPSDE